MRQKATSWYLNIHQQKQPETFLLTKEPNFRGFVFYFMYYYFSKQKILFTKKGLASFFPLVSQSSLIWFKCFFSLGENNEAVPMLLKHKNWQHQPGNLYQQYIRRKTYKIRIFKKKTIQNKKVYLNWRQLAQQFLTSFDVDGAIYSLGVQGFQIRYL